MTDKTDNQVDQISEVEESENQEVDVATIEEQESEQIVELQDELSRAQSQADEYMDGWQRSRAEFMNYKKRVEKERAQLSKSITSDVIKNYLDITDDLQRALDNRPIDGDGATWAEGIDLIYRKLMTTIENEGVTPMNAAGKEFDPNLHEAISLEESPDHESGEIIEVVKEGYILGDRVIRPAVVRVAG